MGSLIGYLRVSTDRQDINHQRLAILEYARTHNRQVDRFVEVQVSSRKSPGERGIDTLLSSLQPEDGLIVSELSRLGRSLGQIISIVDTLVKNRNQLIAIKENITLNGTQDLQSKVMITLFGLFAEIERDLISKRTREALQTARAQGKKLGRPAGVLGISKLDGKEQEIRSWLDKGISKASIAKLLDVSRSTLYQFIETRQVIREEKKGP